MKEAMKTLHWKTICTSDHFMATQQNVTGTHGDKRKASGRILERGEVVLHLNLLLKNKNINHDPARG
jgi:hypothetical protein